MAEDWAKNCLWAHGQPPQRDTSTLPYSWVGQNLYAVSGASSISLTSAIHNWYEEKTFYDYDTRRCQAGEMCGHYTQVYVMTRWFDAFFISRKRGRSFNCRACRHICMCAGCAEV